MATLLNICCFLLLLTSYGWAMPTEHWSVTLQEMNQFIEDCHPLPSISEMEQSITEIMASQSAEQPATLWQSLHPRRWLGKLEGFLKDPSETEILNIDGFRTKILTPFELDILLRMTSYHGSSQSLFFDGYSEFRKVKNRTLFINRLPTQYEFQLSNKTSNGSVFDLSLFHNPEPLCENLVCVVQRIFGSTRGIYLTYGLLKFGLHLTPYAHLNANPEGFDKKTLEAILIAAKATPSHLYETSLQGTTFFRVSADQPIFYRGEREVLALKTGEVYEGFFSTDPARRLFIFSHEIGHRSARFGNSDWSVSHRWKQISNNQGGLPSPRFKTETQLSLGTLTSAVAQRNEDVSLYGSVDSKEDFAETFAMYRYAPHRLQQISPDRYQFMKDFIYNGIEYTTDLCFGL